MHHTTHSFQAKVRVNFCLYTEKEMAEESLEVGLYATLCHSLVAKGRGMNKNMRLGSSVQRGRKDERLLQLVSYKTCVGALSNV